MGLKREGLPGEAAPAAVETPPTPPARAKAPTPSPAAAAKPATPDKPAKKRGERTLALRAVKRTISDPYTGAVYVTSIGRPGVRVPGNWIDAQINAEVLKECSASILDE